MLVCIPFLLSTYSSASDDPDAEHGIVAVSKNVPSVLSQALGPAEAPYASWWSRHGIKVIVIGLCVLFVLVYLSRDAFVSVESGHEGVLWKRFGGGTVMSRTYSEGFHVVFPWNEMYLYNTQIQELTDTVEMLSADGIDVHLEISTRFYLRPEQLPLLHQRVGTDYVEKIVRPEILAGVQQVLGKYAADSLYAEDASRLLKEIEREARSRIDQSFIVLHSTIIQELKIQNRYKWRYRMK